MAPARSSISPRSRKYSLLPKLRHQQQQRETHSKSSKAYSFTDSAQRGKGVPALAPPCGQREPRGSRQPLARPPSRRNGGKAREQRQRRQERQDVQQQQPQHKQQQSHTYTDTLAVGLAGFPVVWGPPAAAAAAFGAAAVALHRYRLRCGAPASPQAAFAVASRLPASACVGLLQLVSPVFCHRSCCSNCYRGCCIC